VVSLANFCPNCGESLGSSSTKKGDVRTTARRAYEKPKAKRKASAYNKRYAREYKRLAKKHPRTSFAALAKKAHAATKKGMK